MVTNSVIRKEKLIHKFDEKDVIGKVITCNYFVA